VGYGRVSDEIPQNIPNKEVICKIFSVKGLGENLAVFAPQLRHLPAKCSCERGYTPISVPEQLPGGVVPEDDCATTGENDAQRQRGRAKLAKLARLSGRAWAKTARCWLFNPGALKARDPGHPLLGRVREFRRGPGGPRYSRPGGRRYILSANKKVTVPNYSWQRMAAHLRTASPEGGWPPASLEAI
jgi:hypothetical protein